MPSRSRFLNHRSLRTTIVWFGIAGLVAVVGVSAALTWRGARHYLSRDADVRLADIAQRTAALYSLYLRERRAELENLAASPVVIAAAEAADRESARRHLQGLSLAALEQMFRVAHSLQVDPATEAYLRSVGRRSDFVAFNLTDSAGLTGVSTRRTVDFVQWDDAWWRNAVHDGWYVSDPQVDSTTGVLSLEIASVVTAPGTGRRVGVLSGIFALERLGRLVATSDTHTGAAVEVVDLQGRLILGRDSTGILKVLPTADAIPKADTVSYATLPGRQGSERAVTARINPGRFWVLVRQPVSVAYASVQEAERVILFGALLLAAVFVASVLGLGSWLHREVTAPVEEMAGAATQVAQGDLSDTVTFEEGAGEVAHLSGALRGMLEALRRLVGAIRSASNEATEMASAISAATEEMSASGEEMAGTTQDLSKRAVQQAETVKTAAADANRILAIARTLADGAKNAASRNAALRSTAEGYRVQLNESITALERLANDVDQAEAQATALAAASQQISKLVGQMRAIAAQTQMLALNAGIEAARAGESGRGFGVVAEEVRKLAMRAGESAVTTDGIVQTILKRVQATHDTMQRLAAAGGLARQAGRTVSEGLGEVAQAAKENDGWSREIEAAASESAGLVQDIAGALDQLASGSDGFASSAEEIAAASQQFGAATEEIAASAQTLGHAAARLGAAVQTFRLERAERTTTG